jgi:hypothetical protein
MAGKPVKCECGCGQAPYATARNRKAACPECGYVIRLTREWIERGLPVCVCGETFELPCLLDCASLPGDAGRDAYGRLELRRIVFLQRSENSTKAMRRRRRCKLASCGCLVGKGERYCPKHAAHDLPF